MNQGLYRLIFKPYEGWAPTGNHEKAGFGWWYSIEGDTYTLAEALREKNSLHRSRKLVYDIRRVS